MTRCAWWLFASVLAACQPAPAPREPAFETVPPELARLLRDDLYAYFRFTNEAFAQRVCEELADRSARTTTVNLHGDAHLEQYAVMGEGRGLMDFDDSARGPALVDLLRLGVSVTFAAERNGWTEDADELLSELWRGYRDAAEGLESLPPVPAVVARIRSSFDTDRRSFLESAEALMRPRSMAPEEADPVLRFGITLFEQTLATSYPDVAEGFFTVKRVGRLQTGIGSALTDKFLLRVEGATSAEGDDLVLEVKHLEPLGDIDCVTRGLSDPFPVLIAQSQLAYRPYDYVGFLYLDPSRAGEGALGADYWDGSVYLIQSWIDNYVELSIDRSFRSEEELREIVFDIGVQLGRGHTGEAASSNLESRRALARVTDESFDDFVEIVHRLGDEWHARWAVYRDRS